MGAAVHLTERGVGEVKGQTDTREAAGVCVGGGGGGGGDAGGGRGAHVCMEWGRGLEGGDAGG